MHLAVEKGNVDLIEFLLGNEKLDINLTSTIIEEKYYEQTDKCEKYSHSDFESDSDDYDDLLSRATKHNVTSLLEWKKAEKTPFYFSVEKQNIDIVKLFLSNEKLDVNFVNKEKIFRYESQYIDRRYIFRSEEEYDGDYDDGEYEKDYDDDEKYKINEQKERKRIKDEGPIDFYDIDQTKKFEKTALHLAVETNCIDIIKLLLENAKINLNAKNESGKIPIECTTNIEVEKLFNH